MDVSEISPEILKADFEERTAQYDAPRRNKANVIKNTIKPLEDELNIIDSQLEQGLTTENKELTDAAREKLEARKQEILAEMEIARQGIEDVAEDYYWRDASVQDVTSRFLDMGFSQTRAERMAEAVKHTQEELENEIALIKKFNPGMTDRDAMERFYQTRVQNAMDIVQDGKNQMLELDLSDLDRTTRYRVSLGEYFVYKQEYEQYKENGQVPGTENYKAPKETDATDGPSISAMK